MSFPSLLFAQTQPLTLQLANVTSPGFVFPVLLNALISRSATQMDLHNTAAVFGLLTYLATYSFFVHNFCFPSVILGNMCNGTSFVI